jgi:hypothetical protein
VARAAPYVAVVGAGGGDVAPQLLAAAEDVGAELARPRGGGGTRGGGGG